MIKISTLLLVLFLMTVGVSAQVFWTENFGTTCTFRAHANTYAGPNGAWIVNSTGTNAANANEWFVNDRQTFNGIGNCSSGNDIACAPFPNNSLHIGGSAFALAGIPEDSASYWTGYYCTLFGFCSTTNKRTESPIINCSGKSSITLSFVYYEGGDLAAGLPNGDATLWYYDGATWSLLDSLAKTPRNCSGTMHGVFTSFSKSLPTSANNNPNVKIGFNWSNDDVSNGTDPSVAVDSIVLSGVSVGLPVANFTASDTAFCDEAGKCITFTDHSSGSPTNWKWYFPGALPNTSTQQNPDSICYYAPGTYNVTLVVTNSAGKDSLAVNQLIIFGSGPASPTLTLGGGDTITCSPASSYQWYYNGVPISGATNSFYVATNNGTYNVQITDNNGCSRLGSGILFVTVNELSTLTGINIYPNPSQGLFYIKSSLIIPGDPVTIFVKNVLGETVLSEKTFWKKDLILDIKNFNSGIYFVHLIKDNYKWVTKIVKD